MTLKGARKYLRPATGRAAIVLAAAALLASCAQAPSALQQIRARGELPPERGGFGVPGQFSWQLAAGAGSRAAAY